MVRDLEERAEAKLRKGRKVRIEERLGDQRRSKPDSTGMMPHDKQIQFPRNWDVLSSRQALDGWDV